MNKHFVSRVTAVVALIFILVSALPAAGLRFDKSEYAARRPGLRIL